MTKTPQKDRTTSTQYQLYECSTCKNVFPATKVGYCRVCEDVLCETCACICDLCKELVCYKYVHRCSCSPYCSDHLCGDYCPPCYWGTNDRFWGHHQEECEFCDECGVPVPIHCDFLDEYDEYTYDRENHQDWHEDDTERFPFRAENWRPPVPIVTDGTFDDRDFEWEVRHALGKGHGPLNVSDLHQLYGLHIFPNYRFKSIAGTVWAREVTSIAGLEHAVNITHLTIDGANQITDLSPLTGLDKLEFLHVRNHYVTDLSWLTNLTKLNILWIECAQVTDLTPIGSLTHLQRLFINDTGVSTLLPLTGLTKLEWIRLRNTKVVDISPLKQVASLNRLQLEQPIDSVTQAMLRSLHSRGVDVGDIRTEAEKEEADRRVDALIRALEEEDEEDEED